MSGRSSVSIWFSAGDFADVLRRHDAGEGHIYGTHGEVARLIRELAAAGIRVEIYSFMTERRRVEHVDDRIRVTSLGAKAWNDYETLVAAARQDDTDLRIPHFSAFPLLRECIRSGKPALSLLASSYTATGVRAKLDRWRLVRTLNRPTFQLVVNHCEPSTSRIEKMGIDQRKLLAWDVPHSCSPLDRPAKGLSQKGDPRIFYAGSIQRSKGCFDVIRAVRLLKDRNIHVVAEFAGTGDIESATALAEQLGVANRIRMLGRIENSIVMRSFAEADFAAVPSHHSFAEGFPLTMFEAIASRTPILCSDHPVFLPILRHRETAMIAREADAAGMAGNIATLLEDPDLYAALSRSAPIAWDRLKGPADWRTLLRSWVLEGMESRYIAEALQCRVSRPRVTMAEV